MHEKPYSLIICTQESMDLYFLSILLIVFIISWFFILLLQRRNEEGTRKRPPGPFKLPIIGNLHQLGSDLPYLSLQRLSDVYGPIMLLQLGSKPTLVINSADVAREIFKTHDAVFSGRPVLYVIKKLSYDCSDIVFAPYGEYWREIRKFSVLELLSPKKVRSFGAVRRDLVSLMISSIRGSEGRPMDLSNTVLHLTNDLICRVAFGRQFGLKNGFDALVVETQELFGGSFIADYLPWLKWTHRFDGLDAKLEKNYRKLDEFYDEIIEEHLDPKRSKVEVEDFVDVMLRFQREHSFKINFTNNHIKGVLMNMFLGGTDTSAATLIWAMTEIIKNPRIMKKAQEEVRALVGKKAVVEESDLPHLDYLKLILKETMRLHPATPLLIIRETTENCVIQGYHIGANTRVFINAKSIMMDAKKWENPEEFLPERFQDNPISYKGLEYDFLPFGAGRRICPGIDFALGISELVLANLLHCFNWELPQGMQREDVDMEEAPGITVHKKIPLCLVAKNVHP